MAGFRSDSHILICVAVALIHCCYILTTFPLKVNFHRYVVVVVITQLMCHIPVYVVGLMVN